MSLEGDIRVKLGWNGARVEDVRIESTRPTAIAQLLKDRSPEDALAFVPRVFSLCAAAQSAAARRAMVCAGASIDMDADAAEVVLEVVHEYFWRLLIDWPQTMRHPIDAGTVAEVRRHRAGSRRRNGEAPEADERMRCDAGVALTAIATRRVFGVAPVDWLAMRDLGALDAWTARGATLPARLLGVLLRELPKLGRSAVSLMPATTREALVRSVVHAMDEEAEFERAPTWNGEPAETGALSRMRAHPLVASLIARDGNTVAARTVARLCELATLLEECSTNGHAFRWIDGFATGAAEGFAVVHTARGLLVHRVRLDDGRIADYRIVAPTEWNFHPDGALARGLRYLAADEAGELERRARLAVQGLDPCVACAIEVGHA